jgi:hypothetical protein
VFERKTKHFIYLLVGSVTSKVLAGFAHVAAVYDVGDGGLPHDGFPGFAIQGSDAHIAFSVLA